DGRPVAVRVPSRALDPCRVRPLEDVGADHPGDLSLQEHRVADAEVGDEWLLETEIDGEVPLCEVAGKAIRPDTRGRARRRCHRPAVDVACRELGAYPGNRPEFGEGAAPLVHR